MKTQEQHRIVLIVQASKFKEARRLTEALASFIKHYYPSEKAELIEAVLDGVTIRR